MNLICLVVASGCGGLVWAMVFSGNMIGLALCDGGLDNAQAAEFCVFSVRALYPHRQSEYLPSHFIRIRIIGHHPVFYFYKILYRHDRNCIVFFWVVAKHSIKHQNHLSMIIGHNILKLIICFRREF